MLSIDKKQPSDHGEPSTFDFVYDPRLREILATRGMTTLMPVQKAAIEQGLFYRQSFLVCAPSGSGKTLVGELAAMSAILDRLGKAAYLVPYRALAAQKMREFSKYYGPYGVKVILAMGDEEVPDTELAAADLLVTTFEKLDSVLRNAKTQSWITQLSVVVVDEVHEIGEPNRGPRLESLLVRLFQRIHHVQVIALSATVGNPQELTQWFASLGNPVRLIASDIRPVPLALEIAVDPRKDKFIHKTVAKVLQDGGQVLVFVSKRKDAEAQAGKLAGVCSKYLTDEDVEHISTAVARLERLRGKNAALENILRAGVGFHHAGLGKQERRAVEWLYNRRAIKAVACTTTLAAGINTPARVVILKGVEQSKKLRKLVVKDGEVALPPPWVEHFSYMYAFIPFSPNQVFQLLGRAGRPGYDTVGQGIVLCGSDQQAAWARDFYFARARKFTPAGVPLEVLEPKYSPLQSQLTDPEALREQVLLHIFEQGGATVDEIRTFFERTFFAFLRTSRNQAHDEAQIPVDAILRVKQPTIKDLVALYADLHTGIPCRVVTWDAQGPRLSAEVASPTTAYHCYFDAASGPMCSCGARNGWSITENGAKKLCPHLSVLLKLAASGSVPTSAILEDIISRSLKEENVLHFLLTHGFIRITSQEGKGQVLEATGFGELATRLYVSPAHALKIRDALHGDAKVGIKEMIQLGIALLDDKGGSNGTTNLAIIELWIDEAPTDEIVAKLHTSLGDVNAITTAVARNLGIAASFAEFFNRPSVTHEMQLLSLRVRHGVKEDVLDLAARVPGVGRVRARSFARAGFITPKPIAEAGIEELVLKTGMSPGVLEPIRAACLSILENRSPK